MTRLLSDTEQILEQNSTIAHTVPWLFDFHASGFMFHGVGLHHRDLGDRFVRTHWFVLAFVPIIPLGIYLVEKDPEQSTWRRRMLIVHRKVGVTALVRIWGLAETVWLIASAWLLTFGVFLAISVFLAVGEWRGWWLL